MSTNSNSGGASGFNTPVLPGYTVTWDAAAAEWVARSDSSGTELRGKTLQALERARGVAVMQLADEMNQIIRGASGRGYSPPPRT